MDLLAAISEGWSWKGLDPVEVLDVNAFGNVIVRCRDGAIWRIVPEDAEASPIADGMSALAVLRADPEFRLDWKRDLLIRRAAVVVGALEAGRCYTLKMPSVLGGRYDDDANLGSVPLVELVSFSGDLARQLDTVPDGAEFRIKVVD